MPADPSVDLAALDALYQAATPGEWKPQMRDGSRFADGSLVMLLMADGGIAAYDIAEPDARWIAALHNAWPAIKRRLEIGDAAVEVWRAEERVEQLLMTNVFNMDRYRQAELSAEIDLERLKASAARARLRALREAQNG